MINSADILSFYAWVRQHVRMTWKSRIPHKELTATNLSHVLKRHITNGDEPESSIIRNFVGVVNLNNVSGLELINRSKCVENFIKGRTSVPQPHTLEFLVSYFDIAYRSFEEFQQAHFAGLVSGNNYIELPEINIDLADLQGFIRVCNLISNAVKNPSAL